ncbi:esterase/lipase family protein [Pseudonocardia sp. HH130629-09]|uniref:esterase/lipase family protein n=1 Tax=Pseudonocardia sp. HH130629-09 TaxID=1641402 RepID=UPI0007620063|nr:alpha/beta fold hydrolase [Pseudonocardia sp. HH130629-09]
MYPIGLAEETVRPQGHWRTDSLPPVKRSLVVADPAAAGTPILLVHGIMDNRSVFTVIAHELRRRGFGVVHAINYSLLTDDVRTAAHELRGHVERLREATGSDRVHVVGHSLGGVIARYYVQRMGGRRRRRHPGDARQPARGQQPGPARAAPAVPPAPPRLADPA